MNSLLFSRAKIVETFSILLGLIEGIEADGIINAKEIKELQRWVEKHRVLSHRSPFTEVTELVKNSIADGVLTEEEIKDIKYVCKRFISNYGVGAKGKLLGFAGGIAADNTLKEAEWEHLKVWIQEHRQLKGTWPYDEIEALVTKHALTATLTENELEIIILYFRDISSLKGPALSHPLNELYTPITGICAVCPEVEFENKVFCITGNSKKGSREQLAERIHAQGGFHKREMSGLIDYLIVGAEGSPLWIYSCFGRKVEIAVAMRKQGHRIQIVHEFDFWDSLEDAA